MKIDTGQETNRAPLARVEVNPTETVGAACSDLTVGNMVCSVNDYGQSGARSVKTELVSFCGR
jgi:hypothetical protein